MSLTRLFGFVGLSHSKKWGGGSAWVCRGSKTHVFRLTWGASAMVSILWLRFGVHGRFGLGGNFLLGVIVVLGCWGLSDMYSDCLSAERRERGCGDLVVGGGELRMQVCDGYSYRLVWAVSHLFGVGWLAGSCFCGCCLVVVFSDLEPVQCWCLFQVSSRPL